MTYPPLGAGACNYPLTPQQQPHYFLQEDDIPSDGEDDIDVSFAPRPRAHSVFGARTPGNAPVSFPDHDGSLTSEDSAGIDAPLSPPITATPPQHKETTRGGTGLWSSAECICKGVVGVLILLALYSVLSVTTTAFGVRPPALLYSMCSTKAGMQASIMWLGITNKQYSDEERHTVDFCTNVKMKFIGSQKNDTNNLVFMNDLATLHPALASHAVTLKSGQTSSTLMHNRLNSLFAASPHVKSIFVEADAILTSLNTISGIYNTAREKSQVGAEVIYASVGKHRAMVNQLVEALETCENTASGPMLHWLTIISPWAEFTFQAQTLAGIASWELEFQEEARSLSQMVQGLIEMVEELVKLIHELQELVKQELDNRPDLKVPRASPWASLARMFLPYGLRAGMATYEQEKRQQRDLVQQLAQLLNCARTSLQLHLESLENLQTSYANMKAEFQILSRLGGTTSARGLKMGTVSLDRVRFQVWKQQIERFYVSDTRMQEIQEDSKKGVVVFRPSK